MKKICRNNALRCVIGLTLFAQVGLVLPVGATPGQIGYFEDKCPSGWKEYKPLAGRVVVGTGRYIGSSKDGRNESTEYRQGSKGGEVMHKLTVGEMPAHTHKQELSGGVGGSNGYLHCSNQAWGYEGNVGNQPRFTSSVGGNQPHNNMQPYLVLMPCIKVVDENDKEEKEDKQVLVTLEKRIQHLESSIKMLSGSQSNNNNKKQKEDKQEQEGLLKLKKAFKKLKKRTNKLKEVLVNVSKHANYKIDAYDRQVLSDTE